MWPNDRLINLLGIELPIIQAPMGGIGAFGSGRCRLGRWRARLACLCLVGRGTGAQRA